MTIGLLQYSMGFHGFPFLKGCPKIKVNQTRTIKGNSHQVVKVETDREFHKQILTMVCLLNPRSHSTVETGAHE